jgi:hypothetical protein
MSRKQWIGHSISDQTHVTISTPPPDAGGRGSDLAVNGQVLPEVLPQDADLAGASDSVSLGDTLIADAIQLLVRSDVEVTL